MKRWNNSKKMCVILSIITFTAFFSETNAHAGKWEFRDDVGRGKEICESLLVRLNRYGVINNGRADGTCANDVILSYPRFSNPLWEEIPPQENAALLFSLFKYAAEGPDRYFSRFPDASTVQPDSVYQSRVRDFMKQKGRLRIWRTEPFWVDAKGSRNGRFIVETGIQTSVATGACGIKKPSVHWNSSVFFVTDDLRGPDSSISSGLYATGIGGVIKIYKDGLLFINGETVYRVDEKADVIGYCNFQFVPK